MPASLPVLTLAMAVLVAGTLTGCSPGAAADDVTVPSSAARPATSLPPGLPTEPPGLGPLTLAQIPADADQVIIVTGAGTNASTATVVFYQHTSAGWRAQATWPAHNGRDGWITDRTEGDLRSPIGVFTLTDAGGLLPDPGTRLPYHRSGAFADTGTGFDGESLTGAFDYVVAINYNREPGTSPLDWTMPLGAVHGGQIWLHVDHGGPTHGCVSVPETAMIALLRMLDPAQHPVVAMGDATALSR